MGTPFMNQVMVGLGLPLARHVNIPCSFGARTRLRGELIQYGAAGYQKKKNRQTKEQRWNLHEYKQSNWFLVIIRQVAYIMHSFDRICLQYTIHTSS